MVKFVIVLIAAIAAFSCVASESVYFTPCEENSRECTINEARISPCREAATNEPCKIKLERNATIQLDFTTTFESTSLESNLLWAQGDMDLPLIGIDTNGCNLISCPVPANVKQTLQWTLPISKKHPIGIYDIKLKLENQDKKICCILTKIQLIKRRTRKN